MKKILITGVNGFIGHSAAVYFGKEYEVYGMDISTEYRSMGEKVNYYQCNMSGSPAELSMIVTSIQPDVILHCAGSANVSASVVNPMADLDGNLHSLYQLLIALKSIEKKPKIIFMSSAAVYGNPKQLPIRETDEPAPISPYGLHKLMCEKLCHYFNQVHGYRIRSLRIFSVYGDGLRKQLLWDIYQKYQSTGAIKLFGTGAETRDYIHVSDVLRAIECVLAYDGPEEIFNLANGEEVSVDELAHIYARKLGESEDIVSFSGETRVGDPLNWRADISLLQKIGYKKRMQIEDGVGSYVAWVKEQA